MEANEELSESISGEPAEEGTVGVSVGGESVLFSQERIEELISRIVEAASTIGCNMLEVAQATRAVNAAALSTIGVSASDLLEAMGENVESYADGSVWEDESPADGRAFTAVPGGLYGAKDPEGE